ncbi:hypothetical protein HWC35_gp096 [Vibrio phage USC-1]|uniref:Virion structural protein n=2 Tax=Aphroditevirus USC1 TaxID=2846605 RepID=A0A514A2H8_9CAUD|nr:hypothetical protein HWC35_gp096 [Vibrio phage USC-1]QCW23238.1 hypothetical protein [Vibrio phage 5 TSL-2019]QDH47490.1 hypothetical protein [Vibrio phage USC-1]
MINNKFLNPPVQVAGLEFMDFQSRDFFNKMVALFEPVIEDGQLSDLPTGMLEVIKDYTGFENFNFNLIDYANLAIDAGYVSPGNILNSKDIELFLPKSQTNLYRWFTQNQSNLMRGTIDFRTGKVGGAYATMPFEIYINFNLTDFMELKTPREMAERLVAFITHEIGHAFSGVFSIHRTLVDSYAITSAIHFLSNSAHGQSEIAIFKDTLRIMEIDQKQVKDLEKIAESGNQEIIVTSLLKLGQQRTQMNSRSLGVDLMNSEVLADVYAVRMGCDKALLEGTHELNNSFFKEAIFGTAMGSLMTAVIVGSVAPMVGPIVAAFFISCMVFGLMFFNVTMSSDIYDTPYRRLLNIFQEQIQRLKQSKTLSSSDKRKMLNELDQNLKIVKEAKPFFEDTAVQRLFTWFSSEGSPRYDALEHYTKIILNNEMSLVNNKVQLLGTGA